MLTSQNKVYDQYGRHIHYLRLSVTDRCNLRCIYCMSENMQFLAKKDILSLEELTEVAETFVELGVKKIRLTGGEPLVRNGIEKLVSNLGNLTDLDELTMTTNGVLLAQYIPDLQAAGVKRINISLDSLEQKSFAKLGRFDQLAKVLSSIQAAKKAGLQIRINSVVLAGHNDEQILPLVDYAVENELDIAFIEEMPLGEINSHQRSDTLMFNDRLAALIQAKYPFEQRDNAEILYGGPARYRRIRASKTRIGFISPYSNNFCSSCNRVRVTVEGRLLLCLGHEDSIDLREILRSHNYSRDVLKEAIIEAMQFKPKQHEFSATHIMRYMSMTGG